MSIWPPPDQPRLPIESTAFNSVFLLLSGVVIFFAVQAMRQQKRAERLALVGWLLGAVFIALQGREWVDLLSQGLTMQRSSHASFFYLIVGTHGLHALAGLLALGWVVVRMIRKTATLSQLRAASVFWAFVVLIWPMIYWMVYLG